MKTIGQKVRELRKKGGLSQEELAFEIGITRQTVSKWESDAMQPTTENIRSLCDFFKVTAEYFFGEEETIATDEAQETEVNEEKPATKPYSKKKTLILTLLIPLSVVVFIIGALVGGISLFKIFTPRVGIDDHYASSADVLAICGCLLAVAALTAVITLIILLKRDKKRKMESFVDKM